MTEKKRLDEFIFERGAFAPRARAQAAIRASEKGLAGLTAAIGEWLKGEGWTPFCVINSLIEGGDGKKEFLIGAIKSS